MTSQQTSLSAWDSIQNTIGQRQLQVYQALKEMGEATNLMISNRTNIPINVVTPRINELRKRGLVVESYRDKCPITHRQAIFWKVNSIC